MFQFLRTAVQYIAPIFVICTMLNVGLTQKPSAIAAHLKNWSFVLKMLLANFVFAPLLMVIALYLAPFDPALKAGLILFARCLGAPFPISWPKRQRLALLPAAAEWMFLRVVQFGYIPLALPRPYQASAWMLWRSPRHCCCRCFCRSVSACFSLSFCLVY